MSEDMTSCNVGACNLCGHDKHENVADKLRNSDKHKVYRCFSCGHLQLFPKPTMDDDREYYDKNLQDKSVRPDSDHLEIYRENFRFDVSRRARFISAKFPKESSVLDVGCGYGFFLKEMSELGFDARGVEISKERRELAQTVTDSPIYDVNLAEPGESGIGQFDVVTLFHVLEHMGDPISFCKNLKKLLKGGGCLIVEVPNAEEMLLDTCPEYNQFYWVRAHLNYFSGKTLEHVLRAAGFENIQITYVQRYGVENLCSWLTTRKPQFDNPLFQISEPYLWLENHYREYLEKQGKTDTIFALAYV